MFDGMRYLPGVVTLTLNADRCNGCAMCVTVCPHAVFQIVRKKSQIVDRDGCMECGACARNCPEAAISVQPGVGCATAVLINKAAHLFQNRSVPPRTTCQICGSETESPTNPSPPACSVVLSDGLEARRHPADTSVGSTED